MLVHPVTANLCAMGQVAGFLAEQEQHLGGGGAHGSHRELLGVLRVLAEHSGCLHSTSPANARGSPSKDPHVSPGEPAQLPNDLTLLSAVHIPFGCHGM